MHVITTATTAIVPAPLAVKAWPVFPRRSLTVPTKHDETQMMPTMSNAINTPTFVAFAIASALGIVALASARGRNCRQA